MLTQVSNSILVTLDNKCDYQNKKSQATIHHLYIYTHCKKLKCLISTYCEIELISDKYAFLFWVQYMLNFMDFLFALFMLSQNKFYM